jgi:uncharacterized protein YjbJ (UPF0337 family)
MNSDEVKGTLKEAEGRITGDKARENEGRLDQAKGKAGEAWDTAKDAARDAADTTTRDRR